MKRILLDMKDFAKLTSFNMEEKKDKYALFFLGYYNSNGCYYMDEFHYRTEIQRIKFNTFGGIDIMG